ncbi:MAG: aminotransferase class III-fold pyridoxal phosphate-dependent enzyme [Gemmatimonadetes bacterium]|nr:aminotransferase class III-fold pyridoxal phosphate-dependent enzyme [Gemmatimonadota bacterium]
MDQTIPGFTSTRSKRPEVLFGTRTGGPTRMTRSEGCRVWDDQGREYIDTVMALGAVALGYGHRAVVAAAERALRDGVVGPLPPVLEQETAELLAATLPGGEAVRFFKTGAEAVAAAVRIARTYTSRDRVLTCGYHGWLDWCQDGPGVPKQVAELRREIAFNDPGSLKRAMAEFAPVAAVVVEPVIDAAPTAAWLRALRQATSSSSVVLIFDEIKTAFRIEAGGMAERMGVTPDLMVVGKALGNGLPIAAVSGRRELMEAATQTMISSTLATEYVSLAAARAVLDTYRTQPVIDGIAAAGGRFFAGLDLLVTRYPRVVRAVRGIPEMCYLEFTDEATSSAVALTAAHRGLLLKRTAYNFMSFAHSDQVVDEILVRLESALDAVNRTC